MALTIELPSNIEQQLLQGANQKGMSLENYLVQLLSNVTNLQKKQVEKKSLSELSEDELLMKINSFILLSETEWMTYHHLMVLRRAETLTEDEYTQLIQLGEKIENANVIRIKYLVALANLRQVPLVQLMDDLGIFPVER